MMERIEREEKKRKNRARNRMIVLKTIKWFSTLVCFVIFASPFIGCAGIQQTKEEPIHAERGSGLTLWKIPIIGFGSWGEKKETLLNEPYLSSERAISGVTALVLNQNQEARHRFLIYEGSYNRDQLFSINDGGPRLRVEPMFRGQIGVAAASNMASYGEVRNLLPRTSYTVLVFSETQFLGKLLDVSTITFSTGNDNLNSCYQFWNKRQCAAAIIYLPMVSQQLQTFRFDKTIDMGAFIDSLF